MKKITSLILSFLLLVTLSLNTFATDDYISPSSVAIINEQRAAIDAHEKLYASFTISGSAIEIYPENYGGDYIEDNILHICIVNLSSQNIDYYKTILADHLDSVVFEDVEYSLQTLLDASENTALELISNGIPVVSSGINEPLNAVVVGVEMDKMKTDKLQLQPTDYRQATNSMFSINQFYTSESMTFTVPTLFENRSAVEPAIELMGGSTLSGYTAGVCGTYDGQPAIGLCGHGLAVGRTIKNQVDGVATTVIGTIEEQQFGNGAGDYAILGITDKSFTTSAMVGDPTNPRSQVEIVGTINRPPTGLSVIKYGKNYGYAYGTVYSSNMTWTTGGLVMTGMVDIRLSSGGSIQGDSGGPVFTWDGLFAGTVSSASTRPDDYGFIHFIASPYIYLDSAGFSILADS